MQINFRCKRPVDRVLPGSGRARQDIRRGGAEGIRMRATARFARAAPFRITGKPSVSPTRNGRLDPPRDVLDDRCIHMTGVLVLGRGRRSCSRDEEMVEPGKLLQRDARLLANRALPSVEVGLRDLVVTLSPNDQHRTCESRRDRRGLIGAKVDEVRPRQRSTARRRDRCIGAKRWVFDGNLESECLVGASLRLRVGSQ